MHPRPLCFSSSAKTHCLTSLKQAVPPLFSRSACVGAQLLLNAGNCVKAQVVLLAVSVRYPFLWVSSLLDVGWGRKSTIFCPFFVFYFGNLVIFHLFVAQKWPTAYIEEKRTSFALHSCQVMPSGIYPFSLKSYLPFLSHINEQRTIAGCRTQLCLFLTSCTD